MCGLSNKLPLTPVEAGREGWRVTARLLEQVGCVGRVRVCVCLCVLARVCVCVRSTVSVC